MLTLDFFKKNQKILIPVAVGLGLIVAFLAYLALSISPTADDSGDLTAEDIPVTTGEDYMYSNPLDGQPLPSPLPKLAVIAVMIDNHPDAWPQAGLNEAKIVYEALAEGVTTRLMAIYYAGQTVEQVGPIRSARPYFIDWLQEYGDALYMYVGGSPAALQQIRSQGIFAANEFFNGSYYWRQAGRVGPHNVMTTSDNWRQYLSNYSKFRTKEDWSGWSFGDLAKTTASQTVSSITVPFATGSSVHWKYDSDKQQYERYVGDNKQVDTAGRPLFADNIVVQFTSQRIIDELGRRNINTIANGDARILRDGRMIRGRWHKLGAKQRTKFVDSQGQEIKLKPGKTWVEVIPVTASLEVSS